MPIKLLKKIWVSYGGGLVMNTCAIAQTKEGWTWVRKPPKEACGQAPAGFLSDYLEKSMSTHSDALYLKFDRIIYIIMFNWASCFCFLNTIQSFVSHLMISGHFSFYIYVICRCNVFRVTKYCIN